ncbi:MAG: c-type cytochrome [Acidobacteriota bacterium]
MPLLRPALSVTFALAILVSAASSQSADWPAYNGGLDGDHYSRLTQIDRSNVQSLRAAWTWDAGEKGGLQTNPLIIGRSLYAFTPSLKVVSLDAATGKLQWTFDSSLDADASGLGFSQPSRGLSWWTDGHQRRLFAGIMNFLYCLDPETGKPIRSFGENGRIDLRKGLRDPYERQSIALTTPGVVYKDLIIVGGREPETHPAPPGDIRAFDVRTGKLRWVFHTIPHPGESGYETWPKDAWQNAGSANNWAGMTLDAKRGVIYIPTGSAVMDFYGGDRVGNDLYANCELALDANTGKLLWYFQGVHHDIWDRDFPSPPALFTLQRNGERVDALAQTTKQGWLYLFDRTSGKPLYPVTERAYPASSVPGEVTAKTQPLPAYPEPFARQRLTEDMLTTRTPAAHAWAVKAFHDIRSDGQFAPFSLDKQTVVFPGFDGGAEWGGPAIDPTTNVLYVNANEMPWTGGLAPAEKTGSPGENIYRNQCAVCHGLDRAGSPPAFPSLVGITRRMPEERIVKTIRGGTGRMPGFPNLNSGAVADLLAYLRMDKDGVSSSEKKEMASDAIAPAPKPHQEDVAGRKVYMQWCADCHGDKRQGLWPVPALIGLNKRLTAAQLTAIIHNGTKRMPAVNGISDPQVATLMRYLGVDQAEHNDEPADRYIFTGYRKFLDPDGYPAVQPPWGTLSAIDLNTGKYLWKISLGEFPELAAKGREPTGSENYGGPIVTAGGLLFIGATDHDRKFRAFDSGTGKLLWQTTLPYLGNATPATYMIDGKQYVVIACSGARDPKTPQGSAYVAFALP